MATADDAAAVHAIYAPVVRETPISFEHDVPSTGEMRSRITKVLDDGYPWLIAEVDGDVAGYTYASRFRNRRGYDWCAEVSVYVHAGHHGRGIGRTVYGTLLHVLGLQGYRSAYGIATAPNPGSEALHRSMGFEQVGRFPGIGWKLDAWHDVICWHIALGAHDVPPQPLRPLRSVLRELDIAP